LHRYLLISGHDYRSPRRAGVHFVAQELAKRGMLRFFSTGFSWLSYLRHDPRLSIADRANAVENFAGVECYLWKTTWHPFNWHVRALQGLSRLLFMAYRRRTPEVFKHWVASSDTIIVESGMAPIFMPEIERLNPTARKIFIVSDPLDTISVDPFVSHELEKYFARFEAVMVKSRRMAPSLPPHGNVRYVPNGFDPNPVVVGSTPYGAGIHAVSIGSMLFDRGFFDIAAPAFPYITFHVIGGGRHAARLNYPNVKVYSEMPFRETLPYLKHAHFGIAPYDPEHVAEYLADSSLKLMQYASFGVPAVCPAVVVSDYAGRFGYIPGNAVSVAQAIGGALSSGKFAPPKLLSWPEVADRIISPENYPDTKIAASPATADRSAGRAHASRQ
jgi:2-beta-glucuronyltransferase